MNVIDRFEGAVRANGYRTCDASTEQEYQSAKAALTAALSNADHGGMNGLVNFAKECFEEAFQGGDMSGDYIQELGVKHGLLHETKFDPDKHTDPDGVAERGDHWFVYSDALTQAPAVADDCPGSDDPEERCPRHPKDCTCWQIDNDHPMRKAAPATTKEPRT